MVAAAAAAAGVDADVDPGAGTGKVFLTLRASTFGPVCASAGEGGGGGGGKKFPDSNIIEGDGSTSRRDCGLILLIAGHDEICELASHDKAVTSGASRTSWPKSSIPSHLSKPILLGALALCIVCSMFDRRGLHSSASR